MFSQDPAWLEQKRRRNIEQSTSTRMFEITTKFKCRAQKGERIIRTYIHIIHTTSRTFIDCCCRLRGQVSHEELAEARPSRQRVRQSLATPPIIFKRRIIFSDISTCNILMIILNFSEMHAMPMRAWWVKWRSSVRDFVQPETAKKCETHRETGKAWPGTDWDELRKPWYPESENVRNVSSYYWFKHDPYISGQWGLTSFKNTQKALVSVYVSEQAAATTVRTATATYSSSSVDVATREMHGDAGGKNRRSLTCTGDWYTCGPQEDLSFLTVLRVNVAHRKALLHSITIK